MNALRKRLDALNGKMAAKLVEVIRPGNPAPGFDADTWPADITRRIEAARKRGERVITIQRSY